MNAPTQGFGPRTARHNSLSGTTGRRWAALAEAGRVVAMLASVTSEEDDQALRSFPARIRNADYRRQRLADNGCADLAAIMEPGIAALLAIHARGADCRPAARALWQEFSAGRRAVLALLPPSSAMGPRRSA